VTPSTGSTLPRAPAVVLHDVMTSTNAPPDISVVLVGVDGSDDSRRALQWAAHLAAGLGAEVLAVHATGLLDHLHSQEVLDRFEREWCAPLDELEVRSRRTLVDGPPSLALLRVCEEEPVGLIVVGSRGVGGVAELGSTSARLVHDAPVPVTVVPPP
jgi:nucleotide-binding universal stress UspA family protein